MEPDLRNGHLSRSVLVLLLCYLPIIVTELQGSAQPEVTDWQTSDCHPNNNNNNSQCTSLWNAWRLASSGDTIAVSEQTKPAGCVRVDLMSACTVSAIGQDVSRPLISGCEGVDDSNNTVTIRIRPELRDCHLTFRRLSFANINIRIEGASVTFDDVIFVNSTVHVRSSGADRKWAVFSSVRMSGRSRCNHLEACTPSSVVVVSGYYSNVTVARSSFRQAGVRLDLSTDADVWISDTSFDNDIVTDRAVIGGLLVGLWPLTTNSTVRVDSCTFKNQFNWSPVDAVMNIFESAFRIYLFREALGMDVLRRTLRPDVDYNVTVHVTGSLFEHNERAMTIQGLAGVQTITVEDTDFLHNIAMHAGAGILLLTGKDLVIRRCTFEGNSAGNPRYADVLPHRKLVVITGDEASVHSKCCKGAVRLIGKGGAIRVQHGTATADNSTFRNNTARIAGGTIFVDRGSRLLVRGSRFSNAADRRFASQQGEIVYSNGRVNVDGGQFDVVSATSHISLFQHSGDRWSIEVYDIALRCPVGFRIRVTNTTSYRVVDTLGLKRSYKLDQLSYFCESCDRYKYSTDFGYMSYTLKYGVLDYFALMINEQYPEVSKEERYYLHDIVCKSCPYGGTCENRIRALPNFWGYRVDDGVAFQLCPKGYCCANPDACVDYDTCAEHRRGRLCGLCQPGYSEALFSPKCVPDSTCGPIWIWPFAFGTGFLYFLFLLFQKDIREFIFSGGDLGKVLNSLRGASGRRHVATPSGDGESDSMMKMEVLIGQQSDTTAVDFKDNNVVGSQTEARENGEVLVMAERAGDQEIKAGDKGAGDTTAGDDLDDESLPTAASAAAAAPPPKTDIGAIMLIMVMYYFQDAMLFSVKTVSDKPETRFWSQLKTVLLGLFKFRLEVTHFVDNVCLLPGLTASQKLLAKTLMIPFVLLNFVGVFALHACVRAARGGSDRTSADVRRETFTTRLSTGFMLALLFMYQQLATTAFQLLNCVVVGRQSVLFLEGTIACYQDWQYGVLAYAMFGIIPFSFALMLGPGLIKERQISVGLFFCACLCPLPFVVYWIGRRAVVGSGDAAGRRPSAVEPYEAEAAVLKVLQGPFREIQSRPLGPVCWAGVLIFRRLVLILFYTFINNSLIRIICMLFFCFLILIVHVHVQPYRDPSVNVAGSVSISALMIVGGINLIRASFEVAEYVPQGPNESLIAAMKESENVLMLWIPLFTMTMIILILIYKVLRLVCKRSTCAG